MHSRLFALESIFAFFYSLSRLIQLAYFVKCWNSPEKGGGGGAGGGEGYRRINFPPPYFISANFSLLPKRGLKVGGGQHTTPGVGRRIMTIRASPPH